MRRILIGSIVALALAAGLVVGPSIAKPEVAPKAAAAENAAWIFYGPWLCQAATGQWNYPQGVFGPEVSPPGSMGGWPYHSGSSVRVSPVWLNYPSRVDATIVCPRWFGPVKLVTYVNVSGVRTFRYSGEAHWMNTWEITGKR